jgi:hypothetical protein
MMKRIALATLVALVGVTGATVIARSWHDRTIVLEQARADHDALMLRLNHMEEMLAVALNRSAPATPATVSPQVSAGSGTTPEQPAARDETLRTANELVNRTLAAGSWGTSDIVAIEAATRGLSNEERARMLTRLTAAMNADEVRLRPEPNRRRELTP